MNKSMIHYAKQTISKIVELSNTLAKDEILILEQTATGFKLSKLQTIKAFINEDGNVVNPINFILLGSHPLKPNEVKRIIQDEEYFEYLKQ